MRVNKVLSAPAGSDPAGLGREPRLHAYFCRMVCVTLQAPACLFFNDFSLPFWSRFLSLPGGLLDSFWESVWLHILLKFRLIFALIFKRFFIDLFNDFVFIFDSKIHPTSH